MNAFDRLSEYCEIVASYVDARGATQYAKPETRQALLAAMGVGATDEASARQALIDLQRGEAKRGLPPVHVHYQTSGPIEIELSAGSTSSTLEWRIELEDGRVKRGHVPQARPTEHPAKGDAGPRRRLHVGDEIPCGYHTLTLTPGHSSCSLIVTPGRCWLPDGIGEGRQLWGVAAQLYLLRSGANWGIGDFGDLESLVRSLAARGADVVGLNPLHVMFADDPEQASPYSPASRLLLNVLNIDVAQAMRSMDCAAARARIGSALFQQALARVRAARLLDYSGVAALKLPVLRELFDCCDRGSSEWQHFLSFRTAAGAVFERSCLFLALRSKFATESASTADWHQWPEEYRSVDSPATQRFAKGQAEAVTFQAWLQFVADTQLRSCSEAVHGMAVGLYRDLAVGANLGGAETWANPTAVVDKAQVGAPPDIYNPQGQDWGLPPFNPRALRAEGYRSFIDLLRANMRHAGGLRIDHVMALQQLYWVPKGHGAADGAYVRYPLEDLVGILALESTRNRCLVVGEDLGTVPKGFRERMERANILSYRVLFFEKDQAGYIAPEEYPPLALAVAGSHDLPTLRAWWQGQDLALKAQLGLYPTASHETQAAQERDADRGALEQLLRKVGLVGAGEVDAERFVEAAHTLLGRTRAAIAMLQLDDLTGEMDPVNVPTTSHEHPNWRRRLSMTLERLMDDPGFRAATETLAAQRRPTDSEMGVVQD